MPTLPFILTLFLFVQIFATGCRPLPHGKVVKDKTTSMMAQHQLRWHFSLPLLTRGALKKAINRYNPTSRSLIHGLTLGANYNDGRQHIKTFRKLGLLHLFSVSGMHMHLAYLALQYFMCSLVLVLKMMAYKPRLWNVLQSCYCAQWVSLIGVGLYGFTTGMRAPAQRATFSLFLSFLFHHFFFHRGRVFILMAVLLCQYCFFLETFLSLSFVLSWSAYLCLVTSRPLPKGEAPFQVFVWLVGIQVKLAVVSAGWLGVFYPFSIIANLLIVPVLPLLYGLSWFAVLMSNNSWLRTQCDHFFSTFTNIVTELYQFSEWINIHVFPKSIQTLFHMQSLWQWISVGILLNYFCILAKSRYTSAQDKDL